MSKRWDDKEILKMIKLYSKGKTEEEIGKKLDRSESAIRLRLETTVYENLVDGKSVDQIAKSLKTNTDTIIMMYYSHKSFKLSRGEEVVDIDLFDNTKSGKSKTRKSSKTSKTSKTSKSNKTSKSSEDILDSSMDDEEINRLRLENEIMETIVKNRDLKEKLKKIIKSRKLSKLEKKVLKELIK